MRFLDYKIILYKDALKACRRRQIVEGDAQKDVRKDIIFLNKKLKQFKKERRD